ncbi:MAG TPA: glycosyltransferase [Rhizomicrobium sp.]|jgi:glycosyltransferase involved in cell wall biosynthesis|nr:glycosyltransferase [Rhizomicrobium sp.]
MNGIVIPMHDFARGGTERIAIGLASAWADAGRDVTILAGSEQGGLRDTVDARVKVALLNPPIPRSPLSRLSLGKAMAARIMALDPAVIFLPGNFHLFLSWPLRRACPRAVMVAKISNPPVPDGLEGAILRPFFRYCAGPLNGMAALSDGLARDAHAIAPATPARVLHDPVFVSNSDEPSIAAQDGVFRILWAGRLEPQKDVGLALKTVQALNRLAPAHLTLLGDGSLRAWTASQIAAMGLQGQVTMGGHVPSIDPYLARTDVLLMTSLYEGQPAVAGEALARGVPVVSTDCCTMLGEMISIPEAGRVVKSRAPQDLAVALLTVCRSVPPPREKLRALVARFAPQARARAYLDWFDELARAHG